MDTPYIDRHSFSHVTGLLSLSSAEVSDPGSLTLNIIQQVSVEFWCHFNVSEKAITLFEFFLKAEAEVRRLDQLKASKMKELFFKKQNELKEICNKSHMEIPLQSEIDNLNNLIDSGAILWYAFVCKKWDSLLRLKIK